MSKILITGGNPSIMRAMIEKIAKEQDFDLTGVEVVERELPVPHLVPFMEADPFVSLCTMYPERKKKTYARRKKNEVICVSFPSKRKKDNRGRF